MVSSPRISIGPAGCRINRDYARRGWATKTSHPNWGARDPSQVNDSNILLRLSLRARIMMEKENLKGGPLISEVCMFITVGPRKKL